MLLMFGGTTHAKSRERVPERVHQKLASYADVYVNDAFGTAHTRHALALIAEHFSAENKLFGYLLQNEITA